VDVTITSVNLGEHDHGNQVETLSSLEILDGSLSQGLAVARIPWTTDTHPREGTTIYTVCASIIFGDNHYGEEACDDFTRAD
jgi:hypothetical protein